MTPDQAKPKRESYLYGDWPQTSINGTVAAIANRSAAGPFVRFANPRMILLLAPVLFWAHIMEEAPGFMRWYNSVVSPPGPENGFVAANVQPLLITALLAIAAAIVRRKEPAFLLLVWLSYFMFANTLFHVTATLALHRYCPGLITALALYLPYYIWFTGYLRTNLRFRSITIIIVSLLAAGVAYMQWHKALFKS